MLFLVHLVLCLKRMQKKGSTRSWDRTQVHSTMRYCDSATFVKDLQRCPSRFGIHACTKFRCQSTVKWFQVTRQFLKFQDFQCLTVLQSYSLTCSLIGTKAYGHGMSSNLELDFFQNPSECATLGIYLRIFQHLQAGEISDSKSFSQFSNKTPSFNTFNTYFQHIHIIPYPIWVFFSVQISSFQRSKFRWVGWTLPNLRSDQTHRLQLAPCARNHCQTIPEPPGFLGKHIIQTDSAGWKNNRMFVESLQCRLIMVICQGRAMTNTLERHFLKIWLQVTNTISTI